MNMLANLTLVERMLGGLLKQSPDKWKTLHIDYEPPRVERCWCEVEGGLRVMLHRIHSCDKALYHPHPWPSAIRIVTGVYEMGLALGHTASSTEPNTYTEVARTVLAAGSRYEMIEPLGWHYVRPLKEPSLSIMVIGQPWENDPWDHSKFGKGVKHEPLSNERRDSLLDEFIYHLTPPEF